MFPPALPVSVRFKNRVKYFMWVFCVFLDFGFVCSASFCHRANGFTYMVLFSVFLKIGHSPLPACPPPSPEPPALVTRWLTGVHLLTSLPTPGYGHNPLHLMLTPSPICPRPRPPQGQVPGTRDTLCSSDPNRMIYPASPALCPCLSCRNPNQNLALASPHLALAS